MGTDWFFGHHIDPISLGGKTLALMLAVLFGGLIGVEREYHGNPAGMRTHILVCVGSCIITITSVEIGLGVRGGMRGDPGHIAAQIVSGIGFLGAGAIMREGATIRGLTSAASIWVTAGIGIALGASPRMAETATVTVLVVIATLSFLARAEQYIKERRGSVLLDIEVTEEDRGPARVLDLLASKQITVYGVRSAPGPASIDSKISGATRSMQINVRLPRNFSRTDFNRLLTEENGVVAFHLE